MLSEVQHCFCHIGTFANKCKIVPLLHMPTALYLENVLIVANEGDDYYFAFQVFLFDSPKHTIRDLWCYLSLLNCLSEFRIFQSRRKRHNLIGDILLKQPWASLNKFTNVSAV